MQTQMSREAHDDNDDDGDEMQEQEEMQKLQQEPRRSRRVVGSSASRTALEQLRQKRRMALTESEEGADNGTRKKKKRIEELAEEMEGAEDAEEIYDVVDEEAYRSIVSKRRQGGDFVVDDNGDTTGYVDDGEEHYWDEREGESEASGGEGEEEEGEKEKSGNKKKKAKKEKKEKAKVRNLDSMFAKVLATSVSSELKEKDEKRNEEELVVDDQLDEILKDLVKGSANGTKSAYATPNSAPVVRNRQDAARKPPQQPRPSREPQIQRESVAIQTQENLEQERGNSELNVQFDPETNESFIDMYWLDMYEDKFNAPGTVFLFGKVQIPASSSSSSNGTEKPQFTSIMLQVKQIPRTMFALPRKKNRKDGEDVTDEALKAEIIELVRGIRAPSAVGPVMKTMFSNYNYAFEVTGVPREESRYMVIQYPMANEARGQFIPQDISGDTFSHIFGSTQSAIEKLILMKKFMGPCWIRVKKPEVVTGDNMQLSWCKHECVCESPANIDLLENILKMEPPAPTVKVLSISLKTMVSRASHQHEIVVVSAIDQEFSGLSSGDLRFGKPASFSIIRAPNGPLNSADFAHENHKVYVQANERALLNFLCAQMHRRDPDFIVGHNISGFELDLLLTRMQVQKVQQWSKLGRLKRLVMPKHGRSSGGRETHYGVLTPGRLVLDTYLTSKELLLGQGDYTLSSLCESLKIAAGSDSKQERREEIDPSRVPRYFEDGKVLELLHHNLNTAWLTLQLALRLEAFPLTLELTVLGGNLWRRTLEGGRSERIEYLLLHSFQNRGYILPDKYDPHFRTLGKKKDSSAPKKKIGRQKPAYSGGLVLDPQPGLYSDFVILLDFNSLYPSIIQEFNICFTTVQRPSGLGPGNARGEQTTGVSGSSELEEESDPKDPHQEEDEVQRTQADGDDNVNAEIEMGAAPANEDEAAMLAAIEPPPKAMRKTEAILPGVIRALVDRRRLVKNELKKETNPARKKQLDVRQKALKITANSMYGCLGFTASRFYAKPLASLVTRLGREILQNTVNITRSLGYDVIYGDTDSIMVNTKERENVEKVREIAKEVISTVNKQYAKLVLDLDGMMKTLLLCKKKKYAALVVVGEEEDPKTKMKKVKTEKETKGLDLVRRDWCQLSRKVGHRVLDEILSDKDKDDVIGNIRTILEALAKDVREGVISLTDFQIIKGLNKAPQDYPDVKGQPHLQVAVAMIKAGKVVNTGDHIPYVICNMTRAEFEKPDNDPEVSVQTPEAASTTSASSTTTTTPPPTENAGAPTSTPVAAEKKKKSAGGKASFADRAFHPLEIRESNGKLTVDYEWYLGTQILPPIQRLCEPIGGRSHAELAELLGLDSSKFRHNNSTSGLNGMQEAVDISDEEKFKLCERVELVCDACGCAYQFPGVFWTPEEKAKYRIAPADPKAAEQATKRTKKNANQDDESATSCGLECPRCSVSLDPAYFDNILQIQARSAIAKYENGWLISDDLTVDLRIRQLSVRGATFIHNGRTHNLQLEYSPKSLYTQLLYLQRLVDVHHAKAKLLDENKLRVNLKKPPIQLRPLDRFEEDIFKSTAEHIQNRFLKHSAYTKVKSNLFDIHFGMMPSGF